MRRLLTPRRWNSVQAVRPLSTAPPMTTAKISDDTVPSSSAPSSSEVKNGIHPCIIPTPVVNITKVGR